MIFGQFLFEIDFELTGETNSVPGLISKLRRTGSLNSFSSIILFERRTPENKKNIKSTEYLQINVVQ